MHPDHVLGPLARLRDVADGQSRRVGGKDAVGPDVLLHLENISDEC